jgi:hypothetical protein
MAVQSTYRSDITVQETLATDVEAASAPTIIHSGFNTKQILNATSSPAVTKQIQRTLSMTAGALTINLASLTGTNGLAVDFTGLKVQHFKFINPGANPITFTFGASNPYLLLGSGWKIIVPAGGEVAGKLNDQPPDVDSTHKNIDVSGTGTDSFNIILVAG